MATRRITKGPAEKDADAFLGLIIVILRFGFKLVAIPLLLIMGRKSLALYLWGRGRIMRWVAKRQGATSAMYRSKRWKQTRKKVYWRNKCELGEGEYFVCEETGQPSFSLANMHVDHRLSRADWPYLAYDTDNLRLVRDHVNMAKSDKLCGWSLVKFVFRKRIR